MHQCQNKKRDGGVFYGIFPALFTWMLPLHNCSAKTSAGGVTGKL